MLRTETAPKVSVPVHGRYGLSYGSCRIMETLTRATGCLEIASETSSRK